MSTVKIQAQPRGGYSHRDALAALGESELAGLKDTADRPGLMHLAGQLCILALTGAAVLLAPNWPSWLAAMLAAILTALLEGRLGVTAGSYVEAHRQIRAAWKA